SSIYSIVNCFSYDRRSPGPCYSFRVVPTRRANFLESFRLRTLLHSPWDYNVASLGNSVRRRNWELFDPYTRSLQGYGMAKAKCCSILDDSCCWCLDLARVFRRRLDGISSLFYNTSSWSCDGYVDLWHEDTRDFVYTRLD